MHTKVLNSLKSNAITFSLLYVKIKTKTFEKKSHTTLFLVACRLDEFHFV